MKTIAKKSALILSLLTSSSVAWAHPGHGAGSGLIHDFTNGLMHPIGGMDHLLALFALGVWLSFGLQRVVANGRLRRVRASQLTVLSAGLCLGGVVALQGINLPLLSGMLASAMLILGLLLMSAKRCDLCIGMLVVGAFALLHGYAHGLAMPLAASFAPYAVGFLIASLAVIGLGMHLAQRLLPRVNQHLSAWMMRGLGLVTSVFGTYYFVSA